MSLNGRCILKMPESLTKLLLEIAKITYLDVWSTFFIGFDESSPMFSINNHSQEICWACGLCYQLPQHYDIHNFFEASHQTYFIKELSSLLSTFILIIFHSIERLNVSITLLPLPKNTSAYYVEYKNLMFWSICSKENIPSFFPSKNLPVQSQL